jgi:putative membrane protein
MSILLHLAVLTVTVLGLSRIFSTVKIKSVGAAVVVAVVFSVLNVLVGWLITLVVGALILVPAILTLGLLFLLIPFLVNSVLLWLTDKLIGSFEIETGGALFASAAIITLVNGLFHFANHAHQMGITGPGPTRWI